jgi:hypothetical protein
MQEKGREKPLNYIPYFPILFTNYVLPKIMVFGENRRKKVKNIYQLCFATEIGKWEKGRNGNGLREGGRGGILFNLVFRLQQRESKMC